MKLTTRIVAINFAVITIILITAGVAFYSVIFNVLTQRQTDSLLDSSNRLLFVLQDRLDDAQDYVIANPSIKKIIQNNKNQILDGSARVDVVFASDSDSLLIPGTLRIREGVNLNLEGNSIRKLVESNPTLYLRNTILNGKHVWYGVFLQGGTLEFIANSIQARLAVFSSKGLEEITSANDNDKILGLLIEAQSKLKNKNSFSFYSEDSPQTYFLSTLVKINSPGIGSHSIDIIVFSTLDETGTLSTTISQILAIIGLASIVLSVIITLLFTTKVRKQIAILAQAMKGTKEGRVRSEQLQVLEANELGALATAFNSMTRELEEKEILNQNYSEFVTLINEHPHLDEFVKSSLEIIVRVVGCGGATLYFFGDGDLRRLGEFFLENSPMRDINIIGLVEKTMINRVSSELHYNSSSSENGETGDAIVLLIPVVFQGNVIAVLSIFSKETLPYKAKQFISLISEQLAIGLSNSFVRRRLEELVDELKERNEQTKSQNELIRIKNDEYQKLSKELFEKAHELEVQRRFAENSARLKTKFLALLSHELKSPLNSILGLTEVIKKDTKESKQLQRLDIIQKSSFRLLRLFNDLMEYAKIEGGKTEVVREWFLLEDLIEELFAANYADCEEKGITFDIKKSYKPTVEVYSDKVKLFHIVNNLLSNSVKYTTHGRIELDITISETEVNFIVTDTGIGINSEELSQIFEEFRQGENRNKVASGGSGLGLTISKHFTDLLGGYIRAKSEVSVGSTFEVVLPTLQRFSLLEQRVSNSLEQQGYTYEETPKQNREKVILVTDDEATGRFTLREILESEGYKVIEASGGDECIKQLHEKKPDLILLDIMMPGKSGFETIVEIRNDKQYSFLPIFAVSARAMLEEADIIFRSGFNGFLPKPINAHELLSTIEKSLLADKANE